MSAVRRATGARRAAQGLSHPDAPARPAARPTLQLSLQWPDPRHRALLPRHRVVRIVRAALQAPAELAVRVVDADEGRALNREWRHKDYATNVLTFDYARQPAVVADVVLCAPVIEAEARAQGKAIVDHYAHLLIHGVLHAQGWDHESSPADARAMEAHERTIMLALGLPSPW